MAKHIAMQKYKIVDRNAGPSGHLVHFEGAINDSTLCGMAYEGAMCYDFEDAKATKEKVTCKHCIEIVEHCRKIRSSEYIK